MKARTVKVKKALLCAGLDGEKSGVIAELAEKFGAEFILSGDYDTPIFVLLDKGGHESETEAADELLLAAGFECEELSDFLDELRSRGVTIPLKAIYTPYNRAWTLAQLAQELKAEHQYMTGGGK